MNKTYIRKNKTIKFNLRGEKYFEHTNSNEYSYAAEPPVQFRLSHLSRRSEPL